MCKIINECNVIDDNLQCSGVSCSEEKTDLCCGMCDRAGDCPECCERVVSLLRRLSVV